MTTDINFECWVDRIVTCYENKQARSTLAWKGLAPRTKSGDSKHSDHRKRPFAQAAVELVVRLSLVAVVPNHQARSVEKLFVPCCCFSTFVQATGIGQCCASWHVQSVQPQRPGQLQLKVAKQRPQ